MRNVKCLGLWIPQHSDTKMALTISWTYRLHKAQGVSDKLQNLIRKTRTSSCCKRWQLLLLRRLARRGRS